MTDELADALSDPKRKRVAIVYHFFAHYRKAVMCNLLERSEHEYFLVGSAESTVPSIKAWKPKDPEKYVATRCWTLGPFMWQCGLIRLALRSDVDAIVFLSNPNWPSTWVSAAIARLTGKKVLFWSHGWRRQEYGLKQWIRCRFYRLAHGMLLYGHSAKMIGIRSGFTPEFLHVIYNSLDYEAQKAARKKVTNERLRQVRRELFSNPERPMIICTSRLLGLRRLDLLLEAMLELKKQGRSVNLLLLGGGPERENLEKLSAQFELDVHFFGECYDEDVISELVMAANVTVAPSMVGLSAIHSLVYGTPVVTNDDADNQGPEWEAIIPGYSGSLFKRNDVPSLVEAIGHWTSTAFTPPDVQQACHEIIDRFYNPGFQQRTIDRAVNGHPADDLYWLKATNKVI